MPDSYVCPMIELHATVPRSEPFPVVQVLPSDLVMLCYVGRDVDDGIRCVFLSFRCWGEVHNSNLASVMSSI